jgi:hypothetical protein
MDLNMLIYFGSRERTLDEWSVLLQAADPRYFLRGVKQVAGQPNTILDVGWE